MHVASTGVVALIFSEDNAIRYVLPVLWMTSCMSTHETRYFRTKVTVVNVRVF